MRSVVLCAARVGLLGWATEEDSSSVQGNTLTITAGCQCFCSDIGELIFSVSGGWRLYAEQWVLMRSWLQHQKKSVGIDNWDKITHTTDDKRWKQKLFIARASGLIKTGIQSHNSPLDCAPQPPLIPLLTSRGPQSWRPERAAIFPFAHHKLGI